MTPERLRRLLREVREGKLALEQAEAEISRLPVDDLGFAKVDHHRALRTGFPEVIFGAGKTAEQIVGIAQSLRHKDHNVLVTRLDPEKADAIRTVFPDAEYSATARTLSMRRSRKKPRTVGEILVVAAGTSDLPVAEEAAVTAEIFGNRVCRIHDVGVAGLHRLLSHEKDLRKASVLIVVAGMEGALPSVVAGLVDRPVIAVPTSIGYGASFGGLAALLAMLNSCAAGVTVVNIDNGFGAAVAATMINRR